MKKILGLFGVLALASSISFAAIYENDTALPELLKTQGYSQATLEMVDTTAAMHRGPEGNYERRFQSKVDTDNKLRVYKHIKRYIDPVQDDGLFGEHAINFSNSWQGDDTHYTHMKEMKPKFKEGYKKPQTIQAEAEEIIEDL